MLASTSNMKINDRRKTAQIVLSDGIRRMLVNKTCSLLLNSIKIILLGDWNASTCQSYVDLQRNEVLLMGFCENRCVWKIIWIVHIALKYQASFQLSSTRRCKTTDSHFFFQLKFFLSTANSHHTVQIQFLKNKKTFFITMMDPKFCVYYDIYSIESLLQFLNFHQHKQMKFLNRRKTAHGLLVFWEIEIKNKTLCLFIHFDFLWIYAKLQQQY